MIFAYRYNRCRAAGMVAAAGALLLSARAANAQQPLPAAPVTPVPAPTPVLPAGVTPAAPATEPPFTSPFVTPSVPAGTPDALLSIPADYRLDIGDSVRVDVPAPWNISSTVAIPVDGKVRLPKLKAPVETRGLTCSELAEALRRGWSWQYRIRPGQVSVAVAAMRPRRITVQGNAGRNGETELKPGWRITNLVSSMSGTQNPERLTVTITNPRRPQPVTVDLPAAQADANGPANVALLEGDTVSIMQPRSVRLMIQGEGPMGLYEVDERQGLRYILTQLKYNITNTTGDTRGAYIIRKEKPGDPQSDEHHIPVNLYAVVNGDAREMPVQDMDLLFIPPTTRYVLLFGEINGRGKIQLPEHKKTYLADIIAGAGGGIRGVSALNRIVIHRPLPGGVIKTTEVDFTRYERRNDPAANPEILSGDTIAVPHVKQQGLSQVLNNLGMYQLLKSLIPFGK